MSNDPVDVPQILRDLVDEVGFDAVLFALATEADSRTMNYEAGSDKAKLLLQLFGKLDNLGTWINMNKLRFP